LVEFSKSIRELDVFLYYSDLFKDPTKQLLDAIRLSKRLQVVRFGKTFYSSFVEDLRDILVHNSSIESFTVTQSDSLWTNYNCVRFYLRLGNPRTRDLSGLTFCDDRDQEILCF
ncbi:hypothetical protein HK098_007635, partial [Nowakowskiella sp. JEL0407]